MRRTKLFRATFLALACSATMVASAQPNAVKPIDVPAGDLVSALATLAKQSGVEIIYRADQLKGVHSKGARGKLSTDDALARILEGSGYGVRRDASGAIVVVKVVGQTREAPVQPAKAEAVPAEAAASRVTTLPEILVKGSLSLNADVQRTEDDVQPYVVFNREDIDLSLASNLEEFLSTRLPMNTTRGTASRNLPEGDAGNRSSFNLRGLGTNQTLILINGRRAPGVSTLLTGDLGQPDVNGLPLSAIERIEVLPTTASGIYGGGATGGVINIILRKDYVGNEVRLSYDNTFDTDSARTRLDFSTGFVLGGGRTNVMVSGSYSDGNDLLVGDRPYALRGRELVMANDPARLATAGVLGQQSNIFATTNLVLRDGTPLGSPLATVPWGYAGGDAGHGLLAGAGQTDINIPATIAGGRQSLSAVPTTKNLGVTVRHDFNDSIAGYLDYGTYSNTGTTMWAGFGLTPISLAANAPGNPFKQAIRVSIPVYGDALEQTSTGVSDTDRLNAGVTFKLPAGWAGSLDFTWNESTNTTRQSPSTLDINAIAAAVRSGQLNVFRDLQLYPLDLSPYFVDSLSAYGPGKGSLSDLSLRVGGALFELPAGEVQLSALLSGRREEAEDTLQVVSRQFSGGSAGQSTASYRYLPARHQDIRSFYVEATAPLVAPDQGVRFVNSFDLQASFRRDEYKTVSVPPTTRLELPTADSPIPSYSYQTSDTASNDFTLGFRYQPVADLTFRASYGTGFLPPSLAQTAFEQFEGQQFISDPKRGGVLMLTEPMLMSFGGSAEVKPEESKSFSAGAIYMPKFLPGLRLSADYTRITKTDEITTLTGQQIVDLEDQLPGRIVRGANLPTDPPGYAGVITEMDMTLFNTAASKVEAWDFQGDYDLQLSGKAELKFYGVATLESTMERKLIFTSPTIDRVDYSDGPLRWRANAGFVWKVGAWTTSLNSQWYDDYLVYSSTSSLASRTTLTRSQGSTKIGTQIYTDVATRYTFSSTSRLAGMWISLGIRNIFNAAPPTVATTDSRGGYSTYADPRGRTYILTLQHAF